MKALARCNKDRHGGFEGFALPVVVVVVIVVVVIVAVRRPKGVEREPNNTREGR